MTVSLRNSIPQNLIQIHEEVDGVRSLPLDSYDESTIDKVLSFKNRLLTEVRPLRQLGPLDAHIAHEINSIDRKLAFIFSKARSHVVCMPRTYLDYDRGDTSAHKIVEILQLLQREEDHREDVLQLIGTKFSENEKKLLFRNMLGIQGNFDRENMTWEEFSIAPLKDITTSVHMLLTPSHILSTVQQYAGSGSNAYKAYRFFQLLPEDMQLSILTLCEVNQNFGSSTEIFARFRSVLIISESGFSRYQSTHDDAICDMLHGSESRRSPISALIDALRNGKIDHARLLLSSVQIISDRDCEPLLCAAVASGNLEILSAILQCPLLSRAIEYNQVLVDAIRQNRMDLVLCLLDSGINISDRLWSNAARESSANNEIAALLLDRAAVRSERLQENVLSTFLNFAINSDHQDVIDFCMNHIALLRTPAHVHSVLLSAVIHNHRDIVRHFFSEGRSLSRDDLNEIFSRVLNNPIHLDILDFLVSQGATLNYRDLDHAIQGSLIQRNCDRLLFYIQHFSDNVGIATQSLDSIILIACSEGRLDLLEASLRAGPIHNEAREVALTQARQDIRSQAQDLLSHARIDDRIVGRVDPLPRLNSSFNSSGIVDAFYVQLSDIEKDPVHYLDQLCELNRLPSRVVLLDSQRTIDLGGVSKECYYTLVQALLKNGLLSISEEGFPIQISGKDSKTFELLRKLGQIYSLIDMANQTRRDKLLVGPVFSPCFFETVRCVVLHKADEEALVHVAEIAKKDNETNLVSLQLLQCKDDEGRFASLSQKLQDITWCDEDKILEVAKDSLMFYVNAARAFTVGCTQGMIQRICSLQADSLLSDIQGQELSSEGILAVLRCEQSVQSSSMDQKFEWIKERIQASDVEWRRNFVLAISGSKVLQPGRVFVIRDRSSDRNGVFEFHTCFNSLDVPSSANITKEDFLMALDAAIGKGYNYS